MNNYNWVLTWAGESKPITPEQVPIYITGFQCWQVANYDVQEIYEIEFPLIAFGGMEGKLTGTRK